MSNLILPVKYQKNSTVKFYVNTYEMNIGKIVSVINFLSQADIIIIQIINEIKRLKLENADVLIIAITNSGSKNQNLFCVLNLKMYNKFSFREELEDFFDECFKEK